MIKTLALAAFLVAGFVTPTTASSPSLDASKSCCACCQHCKDCGCATKGAKSGCCDCGCCGSGCCTKH